MDNGMIGKMQDIVYIWYEEAARQVLHPKMEIQTVQAVASLSHETIPSEFIRAPHHQPEITALHSTFLEVPVIDMKNDTDIVRKMSEASMEWGIFQVVNHGIPDEVIGNLQRVGKEFFELPQEEKLRVARVPGSDSVEGYGTKFLKEEKRNRGWVDHLFHRLWPPSAIDYRFWPKNPPSFREANEEYANRLHGVIDRIFKCVSMGLGLEPEKVKEALSGGEQMMYLMKINYYPPCPQPDLTLGVVAHTDMSAITMLVPNEVPGLQVFKNECWYDVKYVPNALIVHIGEQIEILSNGKYKSVYHRTTVNKNKTRMSWPVFVEPPPEQEIGPFPELISEENPVKYKTKKFKDYIYCKLNKIPQ